MAKTFKNLKGVISSAAIVSVLFFSTAANAQLNQQSGVADPGRAEERITEQRLLPQVGPRVNVKSVALLNAPAGAENIKFNFGGVRFSGIGVYSEDELYQTYEDKIGTEISLADLYAIANQLTLKYRNDGYILTQVIVPPQTIENGITDLQIVEGYIDNVLIQSETATEYELNMIEAYASQIANGGALNIAEMERQLLLINDLPGVDARSIISPSATTSGAADLLIIIEENPFEGSVGIDNYGSRFLGPFQVSGAARLNSILNLNEAITTQVVAAPDKGLELAFGSLSYEQPIGRYGTKLSLRGAVTETDPGYTLDQFDVKGISRTISFQATHPIIRSRGVNLFGRILFDWRNVETKNNIELTRKDRIRALRTGLRAEYLDTIVGVGVNTVDVIFSQGLDIMGASNQGDANMSRASGDPTFSKVNLALQRLQRVTNSFNILFEGRGQLSNNPLLSSEEFGLGGIASVRGFEPSEVVGDDGIAGKVELQWNSPTRETQIFGFLDSGTVWNQDATNSGAKRNSLTSTGFGVRLDLPMDVNAEFIAAQPLNRDISTQGERDPQFFFSLNKKF